MTEQEKTSEKRGVTRRQALGMGAAAAGAVAAGSVLRAGSASADTAFPVAPEPTTLARTLQHDQPNNYRHIVVGPGEPTLPRTELLPTSPAPATTRVALAAFAQLTDMHLIDAQSPARVEFLDRLNDPDSPLASSVPFSSAYRPWEMLTVQVAEAMVQQINAMAGGAPVTGRPLDFSVCTGDNVDNKQYNELRWHIDVLDGGKTVRPDSGSTARWEGVGDRYDFDTSYWHPDGKPLLSSVDNYKAKYGYPTVPGLLDNCRKPFTATGLQTPWYTVFGNHDGLVQGTVPSLGIIGAVATGALKVTGLPLGLDVSALLTRLAAGDAAALATLLTVGPAKLVTPDGNRRMIDRQQIVAEHFTTTGSPVGHGYTSQNVAAGTAYYAFDKGPVHFISLDTCTPEGYDEGSIDTAQMAWLTAQLEANSSKHLDASGNWVSSPGTDKLIVLFSHHTIATMNNPFGIGRVLGPAVQALLLQYPNVIAWVNGHTHRNQVLPHARAAGTAAPGGFWEINTAAHVDWPSQSRVVEIVDNGNHTLSVFGTIFDHAAPTNWSPNPNGPIQLAALARELAVNDPQRDPETAASDGRRGTITDRNVELLLPKPF
ncbi:MAG: TIGR03767 family metallophosphoesterase [Jatrophihabitans sp.]|uniref:TIGR03767 family metallophosphoesterase n=1 Tax=Jatrophihabitans sp. TaxID=1932789 RepID=UPI003913B79B